MTRARHRLSTPRRLSVGSDVEIAQNIRLELLQHGETPYADGLFWRYERTYWRPIPDSQLRQIVHRYDGTSYGNGMVRLNRARVNSVLSELAAQLNDPEFFADAPLGINCLSGFIVFDHNGDPDQRAHHPEQRQRHVINAAWVPSEHVPEGTLLGKLLYGCFHGDADAREKVDLLGEIAGVAALGIATRQIDPKAVILLGRTAENGKSQILDALRGLFPGTAVASIAPLKFADERQVVRLVGKRLNTSDELGTAAAISSDAFKAIVTGEPITGRDVYQPGVTFQPEAQHVFACNQLPNFQGGMDRGVLRRLIVIPFNRTVPEQERVLHIGMRIAKEELGALLSFAVDGAARFLKQGGHFTEPASSKAALAEWAQTSDPVQGWLAERVVIVIGNDAPRISSRDAYEDFKDYAVEEGYREQYLPTINHFVQRVAAATAAAGVQHIHSGSFRGFQGIGLRRRGTGQAQPSGRNSDPGRTRKTGS